MYDLVFLVAWGFGCFFCLLTLVTILTLSIL